MTESQEKYADTVYGPVTRSRKDVVKWIYHRASAFGGDTKALGVACGSDRSTFPGIVKKWQDAPDAKGTIRPWTYQGMVNYDRMKAGLPIEEAKEAVDYGLPEIQRRLDEFNEFIQNVEATPYIAGNTVALKLSTIIS